MRIKFAAACLLAAIPAGVVISDPASSGAQDVPVQQAPTVTTPAFVPPPPPKCATVKQHRRAIRKALRYSHRGGNFLAHKNERAMERASDMRSCAKEHFPVRYKKMRHAYRVRKRAFDWHRQIDLATPFGAWAIPPAIVRCEGGFNGWSTWNHGGSGAAGPYQLLGWGAPMPANTPQRMAAHHLIAGRLYRASGTGPWVSSAGCWS
jgi:hypothetical protein